MTAQISGSSVTSSRSHSLSGTSSPTHFTSSHAGYGNRSAQVTAQVITGHTIQVVIIDGIVDTAVIDGKWDEIGQFLIGSELSLSYQPKDVREDAVAGLGRELRKGIHTGADR